MNKNLIYVAAPYTILKADGTEDMEAINARMELFASFMCALSKQGLNPCSPLLMHYTRANQTLPGDWDFWMNYTTLLLQSCKTMIVLTMDGWNKSMGVAEEIKIAKSKGIAIILLSADIFVEK